MRRNLATPGLPPRPLGEVASGGELARVCLALKRALAEFDELFQKFRYEHMQLIHRTIGFGSKSLKGRPVEILEEGMRHKFFPELWVVRGEMTDRWGAEYGTKRDPLGGHH